MTRRVGRQPWTDDSGVATFPDVTGRLPHLPYS